MTYVVSNGVDQTDGPVEVNFDGGTNEYPSFFPYLTGREVATLDDGMSVQFSVGAMQANIDYTMGWSWVAGTSSGALPSFVSSVRQCVAPDDTDDDGDGVVYSQELKPYCLETPAGEAVDEQGCSASDLDDPDGDNVLGVYDHCPKTQGSPQNFGCPMMKVWFSPRTRLIRHGHSLRVVVRWSTGVVKPTPSASMMVLVNSKARLGWLVRRGPVAAFTVRVKPADRYRVQVTALSKVARYGGDEARKIVTRRRR